MTAAPILIANEIEMSQASGQPQKVYLRNDSELLSQYKTLNQCERDAAQVLVSPDELFVSPDELFVRRSTEDILTYPDNRAKFSVDRCQVSFLLEFRMQLMQGMGHGQRIKPCSGGLSPTRSPAALDDITVCTFDPYFSVSAWKGQPRYHKRLGNLP